VLGHFLLSSALLGISFAQSSNDANNQQGTATVQPSTAIDAARILAPPEAALPGSGTPMGAPVQMGVNDARNSSGGAVNQPNGSSTSTSPALVVATPSVGPDSIGGTQNLPTAQE